MSKKGIVSGVKLVENNNDYQLCRMDIDIDSYYVFGDYNYYITYLDKEVMFTTRVEIINGSKENVIVSVAELEVIQVVEKDKEIAKLIPNNVQRAVANFSIDSFKMGDVEIGAIAYLSSYVEESSPKAKWVMMKMIDINSKVFQLRFFTNHAGQEWKEDLDAMVGKYVSCDIRSTRYGYQTDEVELVPHSVVTPPEVAVSLDYIRQAVSSDKDLNDYLDKHSLLEILEKTIYYEVGYHLVEIASELMVIETIGNITNDYDVRTLKRLAIASRGYLLPNYGQYSKPVANTIVLSGTSLMLDKELRGAIDSPSDNSRELKQMYTMIRSIARFIIHKRKGDEDEKDKVLKMFSDSFNFNVAGSLFF